MVIKRGRGRSQKRGRGRGRKRQSGSSRKRQKGGRRTGGTSVISSITTPKTTHIQQKQHTVAKPVRVAPTEMSNTKHTELQKMVDKHIQAIISNGGVVDKKEVSDNLNGIIVLAKTHATTPEGRGHSRPFTKYGFPLVKDSSAKAVLLALYTRVLNEILDKTLNTPI